MAVYFVYRTHDGAPSEKHVRRFKHNTILDWVRAVWKQLPDAGAGCDYAEKVLGVREFGQLFCMPDAEDERRAKPRTLADVKDWFSSTFVEEAEVAHGPHHLQFYLSDVGETAIYIFDDRYCAKKPGKADFLLLDGWELPDGESDGRQPKLPMTTRDRRKGDGDGSLFVVSLFAESEYNLSDLAPPDRVDGLRVPDLARFLLTAPPSKREAFGLRELRSNLQAVLNKPKGEDAGFLNAIRKHPDDLTAWGVYSDWLQDRDLPPAGLHLLDLALRAKECGIGSKTRKPELDRVKVTAYVAQASKHRGRDTERDWLQRGWEDSSGQFIFFDDRWAAAHPTLAAGILTFASRWDVLS